MAEVLVTGGGGFLGRYLVEQLVAAGHGVHVYCRGRYPALDQLGVDVVQGDLRDAARLTAACRNRESVFHTAAVPGIWGSWGMFHGINTIGTANVIDACLANGVQRLIYTSSPSVVFDGADHRNADESLPYPTRWMCHYPHSKALAEQAVRAAGGTGRLRTVALRPHLIWGPRDNHLIPRLIRKAQAGQLRRVGDGSNLVSVAYVENVAAAHLQADHCLAQSAAISGRAYFINDPEPVNLWAWIDLLLNRAEMPVVKRSISAATASRLGAVCEFVWTVCRLRSEPPMTRFLAAQLAGSHCYSIEAARRDFGYQPLISVEEGLRRLQPDLDHLASELQ